MSFKSKDLSYGWLLQPSSNCADIVCSEAAEPSFLRKLRGHYGSQPDTQTQVSNRPRKAKADREDDDAPVYITEDGHDAISKREFENMLQESQKYDSKKNGEEPAADSNDSVEAPNGITTDDKEEPPQAKEAHVVIGNASKRKIGKMVGTQVQDIESDPAPSKENKRTAVPKKKGKKVKLSFDD